MNTEYNSNIIPSGGAFSGERYRVIVSTDIGGSDADDFQSMVHFLLYSDLFDVEGLISSAWGDGRDSDIFKVIDAYKKDYPNLITYSKAYPTPDYLRSITKQGAIEIAPWKGYSTPTAGSDWIIKCAEKDDDRPLHLLLWGLTEDLAQALHDAPHILPKLRVNYIGGPNKKWGPNAYAYIYENFPELWMIEDNSTYRGWFNGGEMKAPWGNDTFVQSYAKGHGALGEFYLSQLDGKLKMGDTPTVARLLNGQAENPEAPSWGGCFEKAESMPFGTLRHGQAEAMVAEAFGVYELIFKGSEIPPTEDSVFTLEIQNQFFKGYYCGNGEYKIRFTPKAAGEYSYKTHSEHKEIDRLDGTIHVTWETYESRHRPNGKLKNHWTDILDPALSENEHRGAKTINRYRKEYLKSFAERLERCAAPKQ